MATRALVKSLCSCRVAASSVQPYSVRPQSFGEEHHSTKKAAMQGPAMKAAMKKTVPHPCMQPLALRFHWNLLSLPPPRCLFELCVASYIGQAWRAQDAYVQLSRRCVASVKLLASRAVSAMSRQSYGICAGPAGFLFPPVTPPALALSCADFATSGLIG